MLQKWEILLDKAKTEYPEMDISKCANYFKESARQFEKVARAVEGASAEDIKNAAHAFKKMSGSLTSDEIIKQAQLWSATKQLGQVGLKSIPFVGVFFSSYFALSSFTYGIIEFNNLIQKVSKTEYKLYNVMNPQGISELIQQHKDNPVNLSDLVDVNNISEQVWLNGISFVTNSIDAVKDIIFLILEIITVGTSMIFDIGLSLLMVAVEEFSKFVARGFYGMNRNAIINIATSAIENMPEFNEEDWWESKRSDFNEEEWLNG